MAYKYRELAFMVSCCVKFAESHGGKIWLFIRFWGACYDRGNRRAVNANRFHSRNSMCVCVSYKQFALSIALIRHQTENSGTSHLTLQRAILPTPH